MNRSLPTSRIVAAVSVGLALSLPGLADANADANADAGGRASATATVHPPIKVTQSYSDTIQPSKGVTCLNVSRTDSLETHWYRRFDLAGGHGAALGFTVSQVVLAVQTATSDDGNIPGYVAVAAIDKADPLTLGNLEPLATVPVNLDAVPDGTFLTVPVSVVVPAGKDMVLEVEVDTSTTGRRFTLGANSEPELADDYIRSADCGAFDPTPLTDAHYPDSNHVLYARGRANDCIAAEATVDTTTAAAAAASAAFAKADKLLKAAKKKLKKATKRHDATAIAKAARKVKKATKAKAKAEQAVGAVAVEVATAPLKAALECAQPSLP